MIINPDSVSFETIKQDILDYIDSKPSSQVWKDRYAGSVGNTIIEALSGMATYLSYSIAAARRESYLSYATARSSGIAESEYLGYSVYRGRNPIVTLTVTPSATLIIPALTGVGVFGEYELITTEDLRFNSGVEQDVSLAIGTIGTESISIGSADLQIFRFISSDISEDIKLTLKQTSQSTPIQLNWYYQLNPITFFTDSIYYWVLSNALNGIDVMYLNNPSTLYAQYKYNSGSELTVSYVKLQDIPFSASNLPTSLYYEDSIVAAIEVGSGNLPTYTLTQYIQPEPITSIQVTAPISHEVGNIIRGRDDYRKILQKVIQVVTGVQCMDTGGYDDDNTPAVVYLTYVLADKSLLTSDQKTSAISLLETYRPYGVAPPQINDPTGYEWNVDVTIYLTSDIGPTSLMVQTDVETILAKYELDLGASIGATFTRELEHEIESTLSYVRIARVTFSSATPSSLDWDEYLYLGTVTVTVV